MIQILSTEHWSLLGARSLAYNEAFIRGGMFLTFLSMSFVALALLAQGMSFGSQFLTIAAVVLAFDFVIGLATYGRIGGANVDDLRAVHGMARIRHAYTQIAPITKPYFTSPTHDDVASVISTYGTGPDTGLGLFLYAITTSGGMIGLIVSMVGGVLAAVLGLLIGVSGELAVWIGLGGGRDRVRRHPCRDTRQRPAPPGASWASCFRLLRTEAADRLLPLGGTEVGAPYGASDRNRASSTTTAAPQPRPGRRELPCP